MAEEMKAENKQKIMIKARMWQEHVNPHIHFDTFLNYNALLFFLISIRKIPQIAMKKVTLFVRFSPGKQITTNYQHINFFITRQTRKKYELEVLI